MEFAKYQHIERFGTTEVEGIEFGECYVFPKIDGTNSSVWLDNGKVQAGSRKSILSLEKDNAGFLEWVQKDKNIIDFLNAYPNLRVFGEWLVPHSLKTYRESAWRKFYVFDIMDLNGVYISYEEYKPLLEEFAIDFIPPIAVIKNSSYIQFVKQLEQNVFLIEDGKGFGEGIVIKRYDYVNKYGRTTWAKIVTSEFKEKHSKEMGAPVKEGKKMIEEEIANKYVTVALCEKVKAKIELDNDGFSSKNIPQLLNTVYYDIINEESWNFVKEHKRPTINFGTLQHFVFTKTKENLSNLF